MYVRGMAAVVAAVVVGGCSIVVPGTGGPVRGPAPALPYDGPTGAQAQRFAAWRALDVCAAHDVAAAERVSGSVAFVIRPRGGFDGCEIVLERGDDLAYTSIELGGAEPGDGPPAAVDGREFPAVAPAADATDRAECGYSVTGSPFVVRGEVVDDPAASCTLAADYLAAVLPRLDAPPDRAATGTAPAFALAAADPCAALAVIEPEPADVVLDGPRRCSDGEIEVAFGLAQVEVGLPGEPALIDGERAEIVDESRDNRTGGCTVTRQASDTTLLAPSQPYLFRELLAVTAPDCATARAHVETILPTLPAPLVPAPGALTLGSLDGNPVADDVGAPFDPCADPGWAAFPAPVRPPGLDPRPFPAPVDPDDLFRVGCDHVSDAVATVVTWGPEDPAGGAAATFGGRPGREDAREGVCSSSLRLAAGYAGVITLERASGADACAVNRAVLDALAALVQ